MNLHWLDIFAIVIYLLSLIIMGIYFSKKNKSTEEYFVGGRSYSGWVLGLSMIGTSISSVTFLAFPADAFKNILASFYPKLYIANCNSSCSIHFPSFFS